MDDQKRPASSTARPHPDPLPQERENVRPGTLTEGRLSEWTGLTTRRLRQIASEGFFPPPVKGLYQASAIPGMFRYLREAAEKKTSGAKEAERRLKNIKADVAEEELLIIRNKYVLKAEIGPALRNVSLNQRAVLLRKFEGEIGPKLAGKKTPEILELIRTAVDEVCQIFHDGVGGWVAENSESRIEDRKPAGVTERPHPGPLPQEREPAKPSRTRQK